MPTRKKAESPTPVPQDESIAALNKQHLELITEIRALALQVRNLHSIFVKRTVLWWVLGIETVIVVACLIGLFAFASINHNDTSKIIAHAEDSCRVRNAQIDGTKQFITDTQKLQNEAQSINSHLLAQLGVRLSPHDQKLANSIQKKYTRVLKRYKDSQPAPLQCKLSGN